MLDRTPRRIRRWISQGVEHATMGDAVLDGITEFGRVPASTARGSLLLKLRKISRRVRQVTLEISVQPWPRPRLRSVG